MAGIELQEEEEEKLMYRILSNQKKRVIEGKYDQDNFIFLVNQAFERGKITEEQKNELNDFS